MNGTLKIEGNIVFLTGFSHLSNRVSFHFVPSGVVIMDGYKSSDYSFNIPYTDGKIASSDLVVLFRDRGYERGKDYKFTYLNNGYYEDELHPIDNED